MRTPSQMRSQFTSAASFAVSPSSSTTVWVKHSWHLCKAHWRRRDCQEQAKQEVERRHRECANLRWRGSEDAGRWSRREMELWNYIHMLARQLCAYPSAAADP
ncbi:hypothetical protein FIBSPDRAFT_849067 [Athelia psychrophila]|uniref:Uncharacterized protein n=1 Tax=Athelia psychrophila TaxID=1759441 RepID=A0A166UVZ2_9AGAM|nr:hypothetical protein FIBSPDRAFT_849067 [Fibularhizoctonia sp. CBS 109695]